MLKKPFSAMVLSVALLALAIPAVRTALATPSTTIIQVNSTVDWPGEGPGTGNCHTAPASPAAGACTLRAAIMEADATSGEGATVSVPAGIFSLTISADITDAANTGDLNLTTPASGNPLITIVGAGASSTIIDANHIDRVLTVAAGRTAAISGLTLRGGYVPDKGSGGIYNAGTLTVDNSTVTGNQAGAGGGIYNVGTLTLDHSTVSGNKAVSFGGGVLNYAGTLTADRSTISNNSAMGGGGIYNEVGGANLTLVNSTLSHNMAAKDGGGIYNNGTANVYNTTIVVNGADTQPITSTAAGGVYSGNSGTFNLRNTLLAGNYASNAMSPADCTGTINSYGENLIGLLGDPAPCTVTIQDSGNWGALNSINFIGPLQNNGGPTWTHALLAGSNAIDAGDPNLGCVDGNLVPLTTDQRGFARVVGPSCDIGAFELGLPTYLPALQR